MEIELEELSDQPVVGTRFKSSMDNIAEDIGKGFATVFGFLGPRGLAPAGPPFALFFDLELDENNIDMEICAPVLAEVETEGDVIYHVLPGGTYVTTMYTGPYDKMESTYQVMREWIAEKNLKPMVPIREVYLNDPNQVEDPQDLMTKIIWPVE
jgi:effector-binding domain-containing protein